MANDVVDFGTELKWERENRGVSLDALSSETKVSARHLEALERGEYEALPGGVFRKGIVRAYLNSIGLDEQTWMARFETSFGTKLSVNPGLEGEGWETFAQNVRKNRGRHRQRNTGRWAGVAALFLFVGAGAWIVWHFYLRTRIR